MMNRQIDTIIEIWGERIKAILDLYARGEKDKKKTIKTIKLLAEEAIEWIDQAMENGLS